ncbi:MAG: bactofilin family protein [Anaerolineales bacterium]
MKMLRVTVLLILLAAAFAAPARVLAAPNVAPVIDDVIIFGDDYVLPAGETVTGSVVVFGGNVTIEEGAVVTRDVVVFGGDIELAGSVDGTLVAIGGDVHLGATSVVGSDLIVPGGELVREPGAQVSGNVVTEFRPLRFEFPNRDREFQLDEPGPRVNFARDWDFGLGGHVLWLLFRSFAISTIALLLVLFVPNQLRRTADAIVAKPVPAGGYGLLALILLPFLLLITIITIVLPPIIFLLAVVAVAFGWVALGLEVGRRFAESAKQDWSPLFEAWFGTLLLSLVAGIVGWVPCVGWVAPFVLAAAGLGGVLLTRFGTQIYPPAPEKRVTKK